MNTPSTQPLIDEKKTFEVLLEALKDAYKEVIDLNFKVTTILLVVLGWFASNANPLNMLCELEKLRYTALLFTILGFPLLWFLFTLIADRAYELYADLTALKYPEMLFRRYQVRKSQVWCGLLGQSMMLLGISSLIYYRYFYHLDATCKVVGK